MVRRGGSAGRAFLGRAGLPRPQTTSYSVPGLEVIGLPCPPSSRAPDRGRRCLCLFCAAPAGCTCCAPPCASFFRERRAVEPRPHVWAKPYLLVCAFVLYCRSLWVCSRSAEHVVSAATHTAANKNMRAERLAAAAQSGASFMPAHCSQNHIPETLLRTSGLSDVVRKVEMPA